MYGSDDRTNAEVLEYAHGHGGMGYYVHPVSSPDPFAHTAPVWIGERGSTDPFARREAARELLEVLIVARTRLRAGYAGASIPRLEARFDEAVARLEALSAPAQGRPR